MEQTLGKRIAFHRKRLRMTQDTLADQLGITAQAVSKWENDQSCPDISILPKLASIFGISTDELLGLESHVPVRQAVVDDEDEDDAQDNSWEFRWDAGRRSGLTFAICVLLVGVLSLLSRYFGGDVSFWQILWPSLLLVYSAAHVFRKFSILHFILMLLGGYSLIANLGLCKLFPEDLIFPICVVLFGIGLLVNALRKPKKSKFQIVHEGSNSQKTQINCTNGINSFDCDLSFGRAEHLVTATHLEHGKADACFGALCVDLSQVAEVSEDCHISVDCSFAEVSLKVPRQFQIDSHNHTAFGNVNFHGQPDPNPAGRIELEASANFGNISVYYI